MTIFEKLGAVQAALKAPKNQFNKFGGYKYRNCEDILEAVKPLCVANKCMIYLSDEICQTADRLYVKSTAHFCDVETEKELVATAFAREEESKKGMDGSQVTGASSSYARKYALNGLLCIDDTKDSDTTNVGSDAEKQPSAAAPKPSAGNRQAAKQAEVQASQAETAVPEDPSDAPFDPADMQPKFATKQQCEYITKVYGERIGEFLKWAKVDTLDKLPYTVAASAVETLAKRASHAVA